MKHALRSHAGLGPERVIHRQAASHVHQDQGIKVMVGLDPDLARFFHAELAHGLRWSR
jgi:hypothetical protein